VIVVGCRNVSRQPTIKTTYHYYEIKGSSEEELRSQLDSLGPGNPDEGHFDAHTDWQVTWSYPYSQKRDKCSIGRIDIQVEITFTYPRWNPPPNAPEDLKEKWSHYLMSLQMHEEGHKDIGIEAANIVLEMLNNLPAFPTCNELEETADSKAADILAEFRTKEESYDQDTNHGRNQGAIFP